jgi:hypothetical protein
MKPHRKHKKERNSEGQTAAQQNVQQSDAGNQPANDLASNPSAKSTDKDIAQSQPADTKQRISDTNSQISK